MGVIRGFIALALLIGVGVGILPNLPPGSLKIIGLVVAGLIGLVVLLAIIGGSGGGGGVGIFTVLLAILAAWAVGLHVMQSIQREQKERGNQVRKEQVILMPAPAPEPRQNFIVEAPVGQEIRIPVSMGITCYTCPVETNQAVWVRWEGEERFKDWRGRTNPFSLPKSHAGSRYKYLQSAELFPVRVEVNIYPE